jgi:hypothetical protein
VLVIKNAIAIKIVTALNVVARNVYLALVVVIVLAANN